MQITEKALKEFEKIWLEDHPNQSLSKEQLIEMATRVFRAVELIYKNIDDSEGL